MKLSRNLFKIKDSKYLALLPDLKKEKTPIPGINSIRLEDNIKIKRVATIGKISLVFSFELVIESIKL